MGCQTVYCASCNLCRMQTVYSKLFAFWSLARDAVITPRSLWRVTAILMQDCAFSHCVLSTATVWLKKSRCTISKCFQETLAVTVTEDGLLHGLLVRINPSGCWLFKIWLSFVFVIWWLLLEQPHPVSISRHTMQNLLATHPRVRQVQSGMLVCQSLSGQAPLYLADDLPSRVRQHSAFSAVSWRFNLRGADNTQQLWRQNFCSRRTLPVELSSSPAA